MKKEILVVGSSNIDLIMKMERLPEKGETVTDCEFMQTFGGKGANQAVAAARSGGNVTFVSCVGDDDFGKSMIENYKKDHINTSFVFTAEGIPSGTALIMIGGDGDNYLSVAPGANYALKKNHIDEVLDKMSNAGMVVLQYEILQETLEYTLEKAMELGIPAMLNFAPARQLRQEYLAKVSILVLNETETQFLTGITVVSSENAPEAAGMLHAKGVENVIITLGVNGSFVSSKTYRGFIPAYKVDAVDATAAGDVYCGTLAAALMEDISLEDAVKYSSAAAALCVTQIGAQVSAPQRTDIVSFMKNY